MTIEGAFDEFERALDQEFNAMNINDNNNDSRLPTGGRFHLSTPCSSSDDSESENESHCQSELIVASSNLVPELPPLDSNPNFAIAPLAINAGIYLRAGNAGARVLSVVEAENESQIESEFIVASCRRS